MDKIEIRIEELRIATKNKGVAIQLEQISKQLGGPKPTSCFCSFAAASKFITNFFNWYDNDYKKTTTNE